MLELIERSSCMEEPNADQRVPSGMRHRGCECSMDRSRDQMNVPATSGRCTVDAPCGTWDGHRTSICLKTSDQRDDAFSNEMPVRRPATSYSCNVDRKQSELVGKPASNRDRDSSFDASAECYVNQRIFRRTYHSRSSVDFIVPPSRSRHRATAIARNGVGRPQSAIQRRSETLTDSPPTPRRAEADRGEGG